MKKMACLFLILGCVVGCAETAPFVDSRREAGQVELVGQSRPDRVAICHHMWWHDEQTVVDLAEAECAKQNKKAVYDGKSYFNCRFITPTTSFYRCE
jgi:hypothetical protein